MIAHRDDSRPPTRTRPTNGDRSDTEVALEGTLRAARALIFDFTKRHFDYASRSSPASLAVGAGTLPFPRSWRGAFTESAGLYSKDSARARGRAGKPSACTNGPKRAR